MNDLLEIAESWHNEGRKVAVATVVSTWGSSPRSAGSKLIVDHQNEFMGSVSGGCIENAVIMVAQEVLKTGQLQNVEFTVADEQAWSVGLTCGGTVRIMIEPLE